MPTPLARFASWLHLRWPAGRVEPLPVVREDGSTNAPGVYVVGDLAGTPLLKFALDTGARVVRRIAADLESLRAAAPRSPSPGAGTNDEPLDLVIVGAGVSGVAAAIEAKSHRLRFELLEAVEPFATIANFPKGKPIYTYPREMIPAGTLQVRAKVKEPLLAELESQAADAGILPTPARVERVERKGDTLLVRLAEAEPLRARRVVIAIGRSGNYRRLGVPGEDREIVSNRLHDPADFAGKDVLVVGGGDSALETAAALGEAGARVILAHRGPDFTRPKAENVERARAVASIRLGTSVKEIARESDHAILIDGEGREARVPCQAAFTMLGREAPLDFLRRSGIAIQGEMRPAAWAALGAFLLFCTWLYNWKSGGGAATWWAARHWFPFNLPDLLAAAGGAVAASAADPRTLLGTLAVSAAGPAFWYTLAYSAVVALFGVRRIRRRRTPYVTAQTATLMAVQVIPLFLLPEVVLPLLGHNGLLPGGLADALFPSVTYGHGREYWRAYGFILAWPLNVYNVFTPEPLGWWLAISVVQTLVLLPVGIYFFGKGIYCGWICSCGALAETLGDTHRQKMPHGPGWNRLNLAGQGILAIAVILLAARVAGWLLPDGNAIDRVFDPWFKERYKWIVDVGLAGIVGYGVYFWYSGRVWCRFFCPLAALMHVYARFSRFAIVAEKKKCISCNVCTSACHQGIDVMSFANRGAPMIDPQCVRCSACVQSCPTGVLTFGQVNRAGGTIALDLLPASPVRRREGD